MNDPHDRPTIPADPAEVQLTLNVVAWAAQARTATANRDDAIRAMREAGASLREIGAAAGMAHASIVRVLERGPK